MRDLRSSVRDFSEPISIKVMKQKISGGMPVNVESSPKIESDGLDHSLDFSLGKTQSVDYTPVIFEDYANVYLTKDMSDQGTTKTLTNSNHITIVIRRNQDYEISLETTEITIRDKVYIVEDIDEFGINTETLKINAIIKNG